MPSTDLYKLGRHGRYESSIVHRELQTLKLVLTYSLPSAARMKFRQNVSVERTNRATQRYERAG